MSVVDVMRVRLARATELGVPSREFLKRELDESRALRSHVSSRVAQAGQEIEDAARQLEHEVESSEQAAMRLATRWALRNSNEAGSPLVRSFDADRLDAGA